MLLFILLLFASLPRNNNTAELSLSRVDDVTFRFIVNATPLLFPPSKITLHLCIGYDATIELSRVISGHYFTHGIRNSLEEFDRRIYDNKAHENLYLLDLDCDYAVEVLRQAHSKRMFIAPTRWLLLQDRRTIADNSTYDDSALEIFKDLDIYPDSNVLLARRFDDDFIQLTSVYRPSPQRGVIWEERGNWTFENGLQMKTFNVESARRRNLQGTTLKACVVLTNPDSANHLTDYENKHIDTVSKINYRWLLLLASRMNATVEYEIMTSWGFRNENGSWTGATGMLQQRKFDIGPSMYMVASRIGVVQFIQLYTHTGASFIFRRPLLSSITNIFTLPFERDVWIAIAVFLLVVFCLLQVSMKWEHYRSISKTSASNRDQSTSGEPTLSDNIFILLGAFAQQGYSYEPYRISTRIVTLMLLLASLSLYASYSANIVSLLQSTTDSINTVPDLLYSSLKLGAQNISFSRHYLKAAQDPIRKAILEQKIEPEGRPANWMSLQEGVHRLRYELFAFYGGRSPIYQLIQDTFQEDEKCGLSEIDYLNMFYPFLSIQYQSPYLEILKSGALTLQEYGLKYHDEYRMYTKKPVCTSQTGFLTIGFTECYFLIVTMGYGMLLSTIVFLLELLWHRRNRSAPKEESLEIIQEIDLSMDNIFD